MHVLCYEPCFPREILDAPVWCAAGLDVEGKTKIPINPYTRGAASVTDPSTWGTFEDACATAIELGLFLPDGITPAVGHVLRVQDGIVVIDLDKGYRSPKIWDIQQQVMDMFESYTELSQSGQGFHVYARGFLSKGKRLRYEKSEVVELYGHARFIVATGNVVVDTPVYDHSLTLAQFIAEHAPDEAHFVFDEHAPENQHAAQRLYDNSFVRSAFLTPGGWREWFTDQSTADSVFMKEILRLTANHKQALALFEASPMARRDKWQKRADYRQKTLENAALEVAKDLREEDRLARAFLLSMPKVEIEIPVVPQEEPTDPEILQATAQPATPTEFVCKDTYLPQDYAVRVPVTRMYMGITEQLPIAQKLLTLPAYPSAFRRTEPANVWDGYKVGIKNADFSWTPLPGFLGEVAQILSRSMLRPSLRLAEAITLQIAQVVVGRGALVMGNGLNMYHMIVGSSGVGKSTAKDMVCSFLMTLQERYGSQEFAIGDKPKSREGLHSAITKAHNHEFFCMLDEGQRFLADLAGERNPVVGGLGTLLTDAYHKSDKRGIMNGSEASKAENSTNNIKRPYVILSMSGLHRETLQALNSDLLKNGFVSRLYVTHVRDEDVQAKMNRLAGAMQELPQWIYERFAAVGQFFDKFSGESETPFEVAMPDFIREKHACFSDWVHQIVTKHDRAYYNRASVNALKLAAIVAIFDNPKSCTITEEIYDWACKASLCSQNYFEEAADEGMLGDKYSARQQVLVNKLLSFYRKFPTARDRINICRRLGLSEEVGQLGLVPYSWLVTQVTSASCYKETYSAPAKILSELLKMLDGAGEITFYHQDHKGVFTYTDQTGSKKSVKAGVIDAASLVRRELERRALSNKATYDPQEDGWNAD